MPRRGEFPQRRREVDIEAFRQERTADPVWREVAKSEALRGHQRPSPLVRSDVTYRLFRWIARERLR